MASERPPIEPLMLPRTSNPLPFVIEPRDELVPDRLRAVGVGHDRDVRLAAGEALDETHDPALPGRGALHRDLAGVGPAAVRPAEEQRPTSETSVGRRADARRDEREGRDGNRHETRIELDATAARYDDNARSPSATAAHSWRSWVPHSSRRTVAELADRAERGERVAERRQHVLACPRAASRTRASGALGRGRRRAPARTRRVRSTWRRSTSGSSRCSSIALAAPSLDERVDADDRPLARLDRRSSSAYAAASISPCTQPASIAATAPPSSSIRSISSHARASSSSVSAST